MQLRIALFLILVLCGTWLSPAAHAATSLHRIRLFTTGGTIQSLGSDRQKLMEYDSGKVGPKELIADLPELHDIADLSYTEVANVGSPSMNTELLLKLAQEVNAWLAQPDSDGAVITHGTATLEETAYFLSLVIHSDKPTVVVGAMRPFSAVSRDGPFNLYNAVRVAAAPASRAMGVLIVLNDQIGAARDTTKGNTYRVDTFVARDVGPLGYADSDRIVYYRRPLYRHTARSEFDVSGLKELPRVDVSYIYQDGDGTAVDAFVAAGAKGIVLTGGVGEAGKRARAKGVLLVMSDRKGSGRVMTSARAAADGLITADNLPPHKARILLRLALTRTTDPAEIQRIFNEY
ncbi:asparaginase [Pseudoxanthomonas winnipegensis]|uniref:asparaginase n=1 Tax=Pseudoxanthomonas winnipegensis TaxID=2480810 RepID=UPI003F84B9C1